MQGSFVKGGFGKVTFQCNPSGLLTSAVQCSFPASAHPGLALGVEASVKFGVTPSKFTSEVPVPFVRAVRSHAGASAALEPCSNILPDEFVADVAHHCGGNVLAGVGLPENPFFPTLDFVDFVASSRKDALAGQKWLRCLVRSTQGLKDRTIKKGYSCSTIR